MSTTSLGPTARALVQVRFEPAADGLREWNRRREDIGVAQQVDPRTLGWTRGLLDVVKTQAVPGRVSLELMWLDELPSGQVIAADFRREQALGPRILFGMGDEGRGPI